MVWDLSSGAILTSFETTDDIDEFTPGDSRLLTYSENQGRCIWDVTMSPAKQVRSESFLTPVFSPNGKWLIASTSIETLESECHLYDASTLERNAFIAPGWKPGWNSVRASEQGSGSQSLEFSPDSRMIGGVTSHESPELAEMLGLDFSGDAVTIWQIPGGKRLATLHGISFAFVPDGRFLITIREDGGVDLWRFPFRRSTLVEVGLPILAGAAGLFSVVLLFRIRCRSARGTY